MTVLTNQNTQFCNMIVLTNQNTLQGHPPVLEHIKSKAEEAGKTVITVLLSEIFPQKLALMSSVGAWVQVACPR